MLAGKSLLLTGKWLDRDQTCTRWSPGKPASFLGVLKVKVKVKGHVICALSWILGMSYSVIDGLVFWTRGMLRASDTLRRWLATFPIPDNWHWMGIPLPYSIPRHRQCDIFGVSAVRDLI